MIRTTLSLLSLSFTLPHELTHYAVARLGTDDAQIRVEVGESFGASTRWPTLDSQVLEALAMIAPTILGSLLIGLWIWIGAPIDGWRLIMAIGLAGYTIPSPADIRGVYNALTRP